MDIIYLLTLFFIAISITLIIIGKYTAKNSDHVSNETIAGIVILVVAILSFAYFKYRSSRRRNSRR
jgi:hypothetical protein